MKTIRQSNLRRSRTMLRRFLALCIAAMMLVPALLSHVTVLAGDDPVVPETSNLNMEATAPDGVPEEAEPVEPSPAEDAPEETEGPKEMAEELPAPSPSEEPGSDDAAEPGDVSEEDADAVADVAEDGIYTASVEDSSQAQLTTLYVTVQAGRITALRVFAAAESETRQETWDELTAAALLQCEGQQASPEAIRRLTPEQPDDTPEQQALAPLLWESIPLALAGEKLAPESEREYLQQVRAMDTQTQTQTEPEPEAPQAVPEPEQRPAQEQEQEPTPIGSPESQSDMPEEIPPTEAAEPEPSESPEPQGDMPEDIEPIETEATEEPAEEGKTPAQTASVSGGPRRVTGVQIAADGTYTATVTVTKTKKNKKYYGTVYVTVSDGVISNLYIYASDKQKRFTALLDSVYGNYIGQPATVSAGVDAVTSASLGGTGSTSSEYTSDLVQAIQAALAGAPAASGSSAVAVADGVYTGTGRMAGNDHYVTLQVTVQDGVITSLVITDADGSWDSLLGQVSGAYLDNVANTETVDAVTSATSQGYREAIAAAIKDALGGTAEEPSGGGDGGGSGTDPLVGDRLTLQVGDTYVLSAGSEYSSFYTYTWSSGDSTQVLVEPIAGTNQATVTGLAATDTPVAVQCTYGFGYPLNMDQIFYVTVVAPESGEEEPEPVIYTSGTVETVTNRIFDGPVIVEDGAEITFESCTFKGGIQPETPDAVVILKDCTLQLGEDAELYIASNEIARTQTEHTLTEADNIVISFPALQGAPPDNSSLVIKPSWAAGTASEDGIRITGTTPEEACTEMFAVDLSYGDLSVLIPMVLYVEENAPPLSGVRDPRGPYIWCILLAAAALAAWGALCRWKKPNKFYHRRNNMRTRNTTIRARLLSLIMVMAIMAGFMAVPAFAADTTPTHTKSISPGNQVADSYTISLTVTGQDRTESSSSTTTTNGHADIVLVIDVTSSMSTTMSDGSTRLAAIQSAATQFVSGLTADSSSNITLITFGMTSNSGNTPVWTSLDWSAVTDATKTSLNNTINSLTLHSDNYSYDTTYAPGLNAASEQLSSSKVSGDGNNKYVIFFSDGDASDSQTTIDTAANAVKAKATVFSIGLPATYWYQSNDKIESVASDSSKYFEASNASEMVSAFNSALQTIKTETTVTTTPMTDVVISDTLSDYVELNGSASVTASDGSTVSATPSVSGKTVSVTIPEAKDGVTYTLSIPVKPTQKAQEEANEASEETSKFPSNKEASLQYSYGDESNEEEYAEEPQIVVKKETTPDDPDPDPDPDPDSKTISIKKSLTVDGKPASADERVTFTFQVEKAEENTAGPEISAATVTMSFETGEGSAEIDLSALELSEVAAGDYAYTITEKAEGLPTNKGGTATYSNASYTMTLRVNKDHKITVTVLPTGETDEDAKVKELTFENQYSYTVPTTELTVSKAVTGTSKADSFDFTIQFAASADGSGVAPKVKSSDDSAVTSETEIAYGTPQSFSLKNGESITFTVPEGTTYSVTEAAASNYTPSVVVTEGGTESETDGTKGQALTASGEAKNGDNSAAFTNAYEEPPLMGVVVKNAPYILFVLLAVVAFGAYVMGRRRISRR